MDTPNEYVAGFSLEPSPPERTPKPAPDPLLSLRENHELIQDLCRYAEGLCSESAVRKRWRLSEESWEALGGDDELVRAIEEAKTRRVRSGALKRELAQGHIVRGVGVLAEIMDDTRASPRHRVDSVKALNAIADPGPEGAAGEEKFYIRIDMGADLRAKGQAPNPGDVITIEAEPRPKTPKQLEDGHSESDEWRR
jgi:hypothetical protein